MSFLRFDRGKVAEKSKISYEGIRHCFTFKLKASLPFAGVKFFGPHEGHKTPESYKVYLTLKESRTLPINDAMLRTLLPQTGFTINQVKPQEAFEVILARPVFVPEGMWVDFLFELEGPPTGHLAKKDYEVVTLHDSQNSMDMDCLCGSGQPKELYFLRP